VESNNRLVWELNGDSLRFAIGALSWLWFRSVKRFDDLEKRIAALEKANPGAIRQGNDGDERTIAGNG
jgi:hypothetical protein